MSTPSTPSSSIRRGARKGRVPVVTIALAVLVIAAAGGGIAWYLLSPRGTFEIVSVDGSSTVYPITAAWAGAFNSPTRQVTVAFSGTGGGFGKFCRGETDLNDASRPIRQSEIDTCTANDITGIVEFRLAYDGLSVVVPRSNTWVDSLTVKQLCRIWTSNTSAGACSGSGGRVTAWNQLNASWPAQAIDLWGPGTASGTYDYFVEVILTPTGDQITSSFFASEDDNVLAEGVANSPHGMGYFGFAYYEDYSDVIRAVPIDDENAANGAGAIAPSETTIRDGTYVPLARPLFIYGNARSLSRDVVEDFLRFGLSASGRSLVENTGYVGLTDAELAVEVAKIPA
jgi:phosphate transport system substrate-binding protein